MNDYLYLKAVKAYEKFCNRNGYVYQEPSESLSDMDGEYIYLNNSNGVLARYELKTGVIDNPDDE